MASDLTKSRIAMGTAATIAITLGGWVWNLSESKARMEGKLDAQAAVSIDHEARIRALESGLADMKGDLKVIRAYVERQQYRDGTK